MFVPLGNDEKGCAFDLPDEARKWRMIAATGKKGPGRVLRDNGLPIEIPIDAEVSEFCDRLEQAGHAIGGRYRLQAVDANGCECCETVAILEFESPDEESAIVAVEPRNNSGAFVEPAPQFRSELQQVIGAMKEGHESVFKSIRELVETARRRDDDTLRTLRESLKVSSEANAIALKALAKGYSSVQPVVELPEPPDEPEPEPALPAQTAMDKVQQLLTALPQILEAVEVVRKLSAARNSGVQTAPLASDGSSGLGIAPGAVHADGDEG